MGSGSCWPGRTPTYSLGSLTINLAFQEIAFSGRSNVGKSSMINALTRSQEKKKLALVSKVIPLSDPPSLPSSLYVFLTFLPSPSVPFFTCPSLWPSMSVDLRVH